MATKGFKLSSVYLAMMVASSVSVQAQEATANKADETEVIQVTGIFSSLSKSTALKRDASGVVDGISAEDIGKFPDTNLAESLQRITGVSIDRSNNEGNQVTVRGFGPSFNLVTLNGRQMPNSSALESEGISRSFNFKEIGSETVSAVEVHKTSRADINSGGIGATINIKTAKPFDYEGFTALGSIKGVVDTSVDKGDSITPEISGMISNTFMDDTVGVLLSLSHAERHSHLDRVGTSGQWGTGYPGQANPDTSAIDQTKNPDLNTWRVPTVDLDAQDTERERQNAQLVLQWAPSDNLVATVDYVLSRLDDKSTMNRMSFWFDNVQTGKADANGTIINPGRENDELNFWAWEYAFETENDSVGVNLDWQASESMSFTFDAHNSTSHANPGALPAERLANLKNPFGDAYPVTIGADFSSDIPTVSYNDFGLNGGAFNQDNIEGDLYQERGYEIENNIKQLQLSGRWENLGDGDLTAINFGISNTIYEVDTTRIYGANFALGSGAMDISSLNIEFLPGDIGFAQRSDFSANQFFDLVEQQGLANDVSKNKNGIEEDTTAIYVSFDVNSEFNDMPFNANIGLRHETTDVTSYSVIKPVVGFNWITPLQMSKILANEEESSELEGKYSHFLPSLNMSLELQKDLVARLSYSNTISRSSIDAMFPATNLSSHRAIVPGEAAEYKASQGNPNLLPFEARNLDLSVEWYYGEGSYVSLGHFRKEVDNFIAIGEVEQTLEGPNGVLTNPSANPRVGCPSGSVTQPNPDCVSQASDPEITWIVSTPQNLDETEVNGWEFNIQHMFGDSGFGTIVNYTAVNSSDEFDAHSLNNDFALTGLSDSANVVAFYEKDALSARIAYNWREDFLLKGGVSPVFTEAYSQIDVSASYDINESVSVFVEGINVTNETTRRHGRFSNQIVDFEEYGARYNLGVRAKF